MGRDVEQRSTVASSLERRKKNVENPSTVQIPLCNRNFNMSTQMFELSLIGIFLNSLALESLHSSQIHSKFKLLAWRKPQILRLKKLFPCESIRMALKALKYSKLGNDTRHETKPWKENLCSGDDKVYHTTLAFTSRYLHLFIVA